MAITYTTAIRLNNTQFTVVGNYTNIFKPNVRRAICTMGVDGIIEEDITASSFGGGVTTVTIENDDGNLTSNLTGATVGTDHSGSDSAFPPHPHTGRGSGNQITEASISDLQSYALDSDLTVVSGITNTNANNLTTHQSSADHDGRYYTETEMDALLTSVSGSMTEHGNGYHSPDFAVNSAWLTTSGLVDTNITDIATNTSDIATNAAEIVTTSGLLNAQIEALDYYTEGEVDALDATLSGVLSAEIDADISTHAGDANAHHNQSHDNTDHSTNYATESAFTTHSGNADLHFTKASINHSDINDDEATKHRLINDSGTTSTELWSAEKIEARVVTATGTLTQNHSELNELDYASAGHTGFASADELATTSGLLYDQIQALDYYTEGEVDALIATNSGTLSAEIDSDISTHSSSADHDGRYYQESEVDALDATLSGVLSNEIDSDISTHESGSSHDGRYYTEGEIDSSLLDLVPRDGSRGFTAVVSGTYPVNDEHLGTKEYIDEKAAAQLAGTPYFLHDHADATVSGYESLLRQPGDEAEGYDEVTIGTGDGETLIDQYITVSGEPNTTHIPAGVWTLNCYGYVDSDVGDSRIRGKVFKRESGGAETLLVMMTSAELVATGPTLYICQTSTSGVDMLATDRLVLKMYAETSSGSNRNIRFYYEGSENATFLLTPVITNFSTIHNDLQGLNNGDYQHLTAAEKSALDGLDYYTQAEVDALDTTLSGLLNAQIDAKPDTMLDLIDTPASYSGQGLKGIRVNDAEDAVEFYATASGSGMEEHGNEYHTDDYATEAYVDDATTTSGHTEFGQETVASGTSTVSPTFAENFEDASYALQITIKNTTDSPAGEYSYTITTKSTSGFTVTLSDEAETGNYECEWYASDATGAGGGTITHYQDFGEISTINGSYKGDTMTVQVDDGSAVFSSTLYCAGDFNYERADADSVDTMPVVYLALVAGAGLNRVLIEGQICNTSWDLSPGLVYADTTTGGITQTKPSGGSDRVQILGWALSADTIFFKNNLGVVGV